MAVGGPGVTISGTLVRLEPGGTVVVGASTVVLPGGSGGSGATTFEGKGNRAEGVGRWYVVGYVATCVVLGTIVV